VRESEAAPSPTARWRGRGKSGRIIHWVGTPGAQLLPQRGATSQGGKAETFDARITPERLRLARYFAGAAHRSLRYQDPADGLDPFEVGRKRKAKKGTVSGARSGRCLSRDGGCGAWRLWFLPGDDTGRQRRLDAFNALVRHGDFSRDGWEDVIAREKATASSGSTPAPGAPWARGSSSATAAGTACSRSSPSATGQATPDRTLPRQTATGRPSTKA
jgi:hypothetical protein